MYCTQSDADLFVNWFKKIEKDIMNSKLFEIVIHV